MFLTCESSKVILEFNDEKPPLLALFLITIFIHAVHDFNMGVTVDRVV